MTAVSDNINALIRPWTETTRVDRDDGTRELNRITHPALLDELRTTITTRTVADAGAVRPQPGSKPAADLDAYALWQRIDAEAHTLAGVCDAPDDPDLHARLSGIAGKSPDLDPATERHARKTTRGWVVAARIVTGHDVRPYEPDVPCPNIDCEKRGTLRIRIADRVTDSTALCAACGTVWDHDMIGQLGTYVRWAADHLTGPRHWLTDAHGQLVECCECLGERQAMAERRNARQHAAHADEVMPA